MKAAVVLMGLSFGKNDKGDDVGFTEASNTLKPNVIDVNNADVFFHTWKHNDSHINNILDIYSPKMHFAQEQIMFAEDASVKYHQIMSRWFSHKQALKLVQHYENDNNFQYDYVFVTRFDCNYFTPFNFSEYNNNVFYTSNWHEWALETGYLDYWFLSNSINMRKYCDVFDKLTTDYMDECDQSNHWIAKRCAQEYGFDVKHIKEEHKDFKLSLRNY